MKKNTQNSKTIFAPAKINLFLHITGRRQNGYRKLDSLVCFADIGDTIHIETADHFSFHITGSFADQFSDTEKESHTDSQNLVVRAARMLSQITKTPLTCKITLEKNLPIAAGVGGGSSDAAAVIWGLQRLWGISHDTDFLLPFLTQIGADVPVCYHAQSCIMQGIGDVILPAPNMPEIPILLVNPMIFCPTERVFMNHNNVYKSPLTLPDNIQTIFSLVDILKTTSNDLYAPAQQSAPEISNVISALGGQPQTLLSRMSGSGATCFGIYETLQDAQNAHDAIAKDNPDWWLATGHLNTIERY